MCSSDLVLRRVAATIGDQGPDMVSAELSTLVTYVSGVQDRRDRALECFRRLAERLDPGTCWSLPDLGGAPTLDAIVDVLDAEW